MDRKNRDDFSYDLWGDPRYALRDGNQYTFQMNPRYGKGTSMSLDSETGIYPTLTSYAFHSKIKKDKILFYKENSLYVGKILKGKFLMKRKDNQTIIFDKGDIFCVSGNQRINQDYYFNYNTAIEMIGIFGYHQNIFNYFKQNQWPIKRLKTILESQELQTGVLLKRNDSLESIFHDLYNAMVEEDRFVAAVKGLDLFYALIQTMENKEYIKTRTYTPQQVDRVIEIKNFLDQHLDTYYSMPQLANRFNMSLSGLQRVFMEYYSVSPYQYHLNKRLEKAHESILQTDMKITAIAPSVGFSSYDNFFKAYKNKYGCSPSAHRKEKSPDLK